MHTGTQRGIMIVCRRTDPFLGRVPRSTAPLGHSGFGVPAVRLLSHPSFFRMASRFWFGFALVVCVTASGVVPAHAQPDGVLQLNDPTHHFLERHKTLGHLPGAFVSAQPLSAYEAMQSLDTLAARADAIGLSDGERRRLGQLRGRLPRPGAAWANRQWSAVYANGRDLASTSGDGYALQANPLVYATLGRARRSADPDVTTWRNTRGLRVSGHVGPVFVESRFTENQERPVESAFDDDAFTAPRLGFSLLQGGDTYDYFTAMGLVGFRSRFFEVRFGRDRNRWGYGTGSLFLSNYAPVYDQLQIKTSVWRLQYTNLFTRHTQAIDLPNQGQRADEIQPRPYGAFHRLTLEIHDRVQVELFESVMFATEEDSTVSRSGFDVSYLNPVIFYRAVERDLGSPDNALVGAGASWIVTPGVRVYGQFLLDELVVSEIGNEWWGNKWGWLAGVHLAQTGIDHLSARLEYARLRPYLYAHEFPPNAFVHYADGLGHPAGPNSLDAALLLDYRPPGRLQAELNAVFTRRGRNTDTENFGADPNLDTGSRVRNRPVPILQGVRQDRWFVEGYVGVELLPRLFVDATLQATIVDDAERGTDRTLHPALAVRWGFPFRSERY